MDCVVDLVEFAGEIAGGGGDGGDSKSGTVPNHAVVKFGDGKVEAVAEFVFHGTEHLAAVFKGLSMRNLQFDGEFSDGHPFSELSLPGKRRAARASLFNALERNVTQQSSQGKRRCG